MQVYLPNVNNGLLQSALGKSLPNVNIRQAHVSECGYLSNVDCN